MEKTELTLRIFSTTCTSGTCGSSPLRSFGAWSDFYIWQLARKGVKQAMENADSMGFINWIYDSIFHSLGFMTV